jgi:hypothetical protein
MPVEHKNETAGTGLYERAVDKITQWVKPYLHRVTQDFVSKSVDKYAKDNPRFARMIEFEVRRRGDGAGLTQDVAEPLLWAGIKTLAALAIVIPVEFIKNRKLVIIERVAATSILLNNAVELFRLVPRYKAGLQGSLEMAKERQEAIDAGLGDPFNNQQSPREINKAGKPESKFAQTVQKQSPVIPTSLMEQAGKTMQPGSPER